MWRMAGRRARTDASAQFGGQSSFTAGQDDVRLNLSGGAGHGEQWMVSSAI